MIRLYQFAISPFCAKVRKILDYKGLDYETVEVDYLERKELVLATGQMMVPALALDDKESVVGSDRIALLLEQNYPQPTILPPSWRGIHLALARYFDTELEDALFRAAVLSALAHYRRQGPDHAALWRLVRERKYGAGFVDQMIADRAANLTHAHDLLRLYEESLATRAFLLGRIGYADFALYGQLTYFTIGGQLMLPADMPNLQAFFGRIDRITSVIDP